MVLRLLVLLLRLESPSKPVGPHSRWEVSAGELRVPENFLGVLLKAIILGILLFMQTAEATTCKDVLAELQLLRKAQNQIISGLADNHQSMADSLNKTALDLRLYNKPAPIRVVHNMNGMASAFRKRGEKAKDQAAALDAATAELTQKIAHCLRK